MSEPRPRFDASRASGAMQIEHCDIPAELTLCEWRRLKAAESAAERRAAPKKRGIQRVFKRAA